MPCKFRLSSELIQIVSRLGARWKKYLLIVGCAAVAGALGLWILSGWGHVTENDAKVMADMVTISSRVDGWVAKRAVEDGNNVAHGDELVVIDQRETRLQLEELRAKQESLRLQAEGVGVQLGVTKPSTESMVRAAMARQESAEANLGSAEAELERSKLGFSRNQRLASEEIISRQAWDETRTGTRQIEEKVLQAKAQITEAQANLAEAQAKRGDVEVLAKQLERLTHDMEQLQAQIRQKEVDLEDRVVKSPVNGVVDQKFVEPGEYVIPGQRLVLLHDPKSVWIEAHLKETKLASLRLGQPVSISVDAYPGRCFTGIIERIGTTTTGQFALLPSPNPSGNFTKITQRVPVRIKVRQPEDNPLRPGMMVEVDIDASHG